MTYKFISEVYELQDELFDIYRFKDKSKKFYKGRIDNFFHNYMGLDFNKDKPLKAITYYDINIYLNGLVCADSERVNNYTALKRFFEYTYEKDKTTDIITNLNRPIYEKNLQKFQMKKIIQN